MFGVSSASSLLQTTATTSQFCASLVHKNLKIFMGI